MSELVEWLIGKDEDGKVRFVSIGPQSLFSQSRGKELAKQLGPEYSLWNCFTLKPLEDVSPENR